MSFNYEEELESAIQRHPAKGLRKSKTYTIHTETGSVYDFDLPRMRMRRVNDTGNFKDLRQDGEWVSLVSIPTVVVGQPMRFVVAGLNDDPSVVTIRTTSPVIKIEGI